MTYVTYVPMLCRSEQNYSVIVYRLLQMVRLKESAFEL